MTKHLYTKFIFGYIAFALAALVTITSFSSMLTRDYLIRNRSHMLYDAASEIAGS